MNEHNYTPAFGLLSKSYRLIKMNWRVFGILYLLPFLGALGAAFDSSRRPNDFNWSNWNPEPDMVATIAISVPIGIALYLLIYSMLFQLELDTSKGKMPKLSQVFSELKPKFWRLVGLIISVILLVALGLILFIIPGLFLMKRYFLSPYYLLDRNLAVGEAMKRSAETGKQNSGAIWGVLGVIILFGLIASLPSIIGLVGFFLMVFYSVAPAIRYQEVGKDTAQIS